MIGRHHFFESRSLSMTLSTAEVGDQRLQAPVFVLQRLEPLGSGTVMPPNFCFQRWYVGWLMPWAPTDLLGLAPASPSRTTLGESGFCELLFASCPPSKLAEDSQIVWTTFRGLGPSSGNSGTSSRSSSSFSPFPSPRRKRLMLWLLDYRLSTAVWVGVIALVGLAAQTGIVMIVYIDNAYERRKAAGKVREPERHHLGPHGRNRTACASQAHDGLDHALGLVPLLWATGSGAVCDEAHRRTHGRRSHHVGLSHARDHPGDLYLLAARQQLCMSG